MFTVPGSNQMKSSIFTLLLDDRLETQRSKVHNPFHCSTFAGWTKKKNLSQSVSSHLDFNP